VRVPTRVCLLQALYGPDSKVDWWCYKTMEKRRRCLPRPPIYVSEVPVQVVDDEPPSDIHMPWLSLWDVLPLMLLTGDAILRMDLVPVVGTHSSRMAHGAAYRSSPLFTRPSLQCACGQVVLGEYVRYIVGGVVKHGQVQSIFKLDDEPLASAGIHTQRPRTIAATLRALRASDEGFHMFIRPSERRGVRELLALWETEDLVAPADVHEVVIVRANDTPEGTMFCNQARLPAAAFRQGQPLVPLSELPLHPMEQFDFDFSRLRSLPSCTPILRCPLVHYKDDFGAYQKVDPQPRTTPPCCLSALSCCLCLPVRVLFSASAGMAVHTVPLADSP
jgi:hypothetical protein